MRRPSLCGAGDADGRIVGLFNIHRLHALSRGKHRKQFIRRAEFAWLDAERR